MYEKRLLKTKITHSNNTGKDYYKFYVVTENDFDIKLTTVSCTSKEQFNRFLDESKKPNFNVATTYDIFEGQNNTFFCKCIL